ncbi:MULTISPECIES: hypothetical protein [unclassified Streptomyces]|uniref:hypothetical protein n=1 Tax=unclassified Streptomyces TaxID=2593676 RepID=UPI00278C1A7E|nr:MULTISPECIES: hypothetical protein [unclassified Streptomyces]
MPGAGFDIDGDALRRYANAAEQAADRLQVIRNGLSDLELSDGVFGQLPESNELRADYMGKKQQAEEDLGSAGDALESVAEAVRESAENYDSTEQANSQTVGGGPGRGL